MSLEITNFDDPSCMVKTVAHMIDCCGCNSSTGITLLVCGILAAAVIPGGIALFGGLVESPGFAFVMYEAVTDLGAYGLIALGLIGIAGMSTTGFVWCLSSGLDADIINEGIESPPPKYTPPQAGYVQRSKATTRRVSKPNVKTHRVSPPTKTAKIDPTDPTDPTALRKQLDRYYIGNDPTKAAEVARWNAISPKRGLDGEIYTDKHHTTFLLNYCGLSSLEDKLLFNPSDKDVTELITYFNDKVFNEGKCSFYNNSPIYEASTLAERCKTEINNAKYAEEKINSAADRITELLASSFPNVSQPPSAFCFPQPPAGTYLLMTKWHAAVVS